MKTAVFNVRLDIRALATLHAFYGDRGFKFDSVSTLVRRLIETQANICLEQGAEAFVSIEDSMSYLHSQGLMQSIKQSRTLLRELQKETLIKEGLDPSYLDRKSMSTISSDQIEAAKAIFNKRQEDAEDECSAGAILGAHPGEVKKGN